MSAVPPFPFPAGFELPPPPPSPEPPPPPPPDVDWALLDGDVVSRIVRQPFAPEVPTYTAVKVTEETGPAEVGGRLVEGAFTPPASVVDPAEWLIDIGPFFDRFGAAKLAVLMSTNTTVRALVADLQVRKWVDLQRPDVAAGIDALVALGVPGVTVALRDAILTTPVTREENLALRRSYFGG